MWVNYKINLSHSLLVEGEMWVSLCQQSRFVCFINTFLFC